MEKKPKKKAKTLQEHMKSIAPLGGKALYKKRGSEYYKQIVRIRWEKHRREKENIG